MTPGFSLIDSDEALAALADRLSKADVIAVDTEFHGEKRFRPELYLLQIADDQEEPVAVDPLSISSLAPLREVMEDEGITKVLHSARNDISILRRKMECDVRNVFDTQVAAAFLGYGEQISLSNLIGKLCGNSSHSSFSLSDWSLRPLSGEQLEYALDDVRFLLRMHGMLSNELENAGRTGWFRDETASLSDPHTYDESLEPVFRKARSSGKVRRTCLPVLWALVKWREDIAKSQDRPRQRVVRDSQLCRIAAMSPTSAKNLRRLRGLSSEFVRSLGEEVVEEIAHAQTTIPLDMPEIQDKSSDTVVSARQDILRIFLKQKSSIMRIAPSLLLPGDTARSLLSNPPKSIGDLMAREEMANWRKEALGEELVALLNGKMALALDRDPALGITYVKVD
jgi:ribonuclease D